VLQKRKETYFLLVSFPLPAFLLFQIATILKINCDIYFLKKGFLVFFAAFFYFQIYVYFRRYAFNLCHFLKYQGKKVPKQSFRIRKVYLLDCNRKVFYSHNKWLWVKVICLEKQQHFCYSLSLRSVFTTGVWKESLTKLVEIILVTSVIFSNLSNLLYKWNKTLKDYKKIS
jgi:hypothetical protein